VTEVGALSAAAWLGVVVARQPDLSGRLGATDRCASTAGRSRVFNVALRIAVFAWRTMYS